MNLRLVEQSSTARIVPRVTPGAARGRDFGATVFFSSASPSLELDPCKEACAGAPAPSVGVDALDGNAADDTGVTDADDTGLGLGEPSWPLVDGIKRDPTPTLSSEDFLSFASTSASPSSLTTLRLSWSSRRPTVSGLRRQGGEDGEGAVGLEERGEEGRDPSLEGEGVDGESAVGDSGALEAAPATCESGSFLFTTCIRCVCILVWRD